MFVGDETLSEHMDIGDDESLITIAKEAYYMLIVDQRYNT